MGFESSQDIKHYSINLPDSNEIVDQFGRHKQNGTEGKMPPLARVSLFVDLCTSMICNARLEPWSTGEQSMAQEQLPEVVQKMRHLKQERLLCHLAVGKQRY